MIRTIARLFRLRLAFLNGVTALAGYFLFPAPISATTLLAAFCGVMLLAVGGSALNQVLERDIDALMTRTRLRPLPQGHLPVTTAISAGVCAILAGLILLAVTGGPYPVVASAGALVWYLAVYTPLKRRSSLALPLGALCGAFPPLIGWILAGGSPGDYRIITLSGLLFIWQIPHFWLLQERHEADYRRAGIPLAGTGSGLTGRSMLFRLWLVAFVASAMLLPALNIIVRPAALWYAVFPVPLLFPPVMRSRNLLFTYLNFFPVLLTLAILFCNIAS